jgi:hypothetical protein
VNRRVSRQQLSMAERVSGRGKGCRPNVDRLAGGQSCVNEYTLLNSFFLLKELREAMNRRVPTPK